MIVSKLKQREQYKINEIQKTKKKAKPIKNNPPIDPKLKKKKE